MVPGGNSNDAPLLLNQEFYDPYGKIYIYNAGAINDNLNVSVVYAKFDTDTDGLPDAVEPSYGANPTLEDTDGDGLTDLWEICYDGDCSSYSPYPIGRDLHPDSPDTDGDGMLDKAEVEKGFSPIVPGQPPTITEFTPASGNAGTFIVITGTNFPSRGASENVSISFHPGIPALVFQPLGSSQILVRVPVGATTGPITISTFWGSATSTAAFVIEQPPTITSINPTGAPPGTLVEISGTNFIPGGGTTVTLNGTPTVSSLSGDYRLYFFVPTGATTGKIKVTTVYGSVDSLTDFIVPPPPVCLPYTQVLTLGDGTGPTNEEVKVTFFGQIANAAAFTTNPTTSRVLKVCPDTQVQYAATATKGTLVCSINNNRSQPNGTLRINDKLTCSNRSGGGGQDVDTFYVKPQ